MMLHGWHFNQYATVVITAALFLGAVQQLVKRGVVPFWRFMKKVSKSADQAIVSFPVVLDMADEFKDGKGGSTLKSNMDALQGLTDSAFTAARIARDEARMAREEAKGAHDTLVALVEYLHNNVHETRNILTVIKGTGLVALQLAKDTHDEVKTINGRSLAQLADDDESRRITDIPEGERTPGERSHLDTTDTSRQGYRERMNNPEADEG